jgi:hypothetical protein
VKPVRPDVRRGYPESAETSLFVFELALAPGRGIREDQWRNTLPLARSIMKARCWKFCDKTAKSQGGARISEVRDETVRSAEGDRDGPPSILARSNECDRKCGRSGMLPLARQPGRKFTLAVSP